MGDIRFLAPYEQVKQAADMLGTIRTLNDEALVAALAGAATQAALSPSNALLVNVLASQAQNRARRKETILATLAEGVFEVDADGRVTFLNPAAEKLIGWRLREIHGEAIHDLLHHATPSSVHPPRAECRLAKALATPAVVRHHDERFARKDGPVFPVAFTAAPIVREGDVDGAVVVFTDITERKQAEADLQMTRNLLEAVVEGTTDAVWVKDLERRFLLLNKAGARAIGRSAGAFVGKTLEEVVGPSADPKIKQEDMEVLTTGETRRSEVTVMTGGGPRTFFSAKSAWRDADGNVIGLVGISRDITERKRGEEALRDSERRLQTVVSHAPVILTVIDRHGVITFSEGRALAALGLTRGNVGRSIFEVYGHNASVVENVRRALKGEERKALVEERGRFFDVRWTPIRGPDGEVAEVLAVTVDVSDLKLAQAGRGGPPASRAAGPHASPDPHDSPR